jgi:hypothetical protein
MGCETFTSKLKTLHSIRGAFNHTRSDLRLSNPRGGPKSRAREEIAEVRSEAKWGIWDE